MTFIKHSTSFITLFPKEVVDELISSKTKKFDWLKIEIKDLKQEKRNLAANNQGYVLSIPNYQLLIRNPHNIQIKQSQRFPFPK